MPAAISITPLRKRKMPWPEGQGMKEIHEGKF
jgi:hypothetical protein